MLTNSVETKYVQQINSLNMHQKYTRNIHVYFSSHLIKETILFLFYAVNI